MHYTKLGARGPKVSTTGFGAWAIGGMNWGPTDDAISKRALHAALDAGVTLLDTADVYGHGHSEDLIRQVLAERGGKGEVIIASKAGNDFYNAKKSDDTGMGPIVANYNKDYLIGAVEKSLKRLNVDAIDILQLHSPSTHELDRPDPWEALATLKAQGKIRHAGWSIQSFRETEQAPWVEKHADLIDVLQVRYNLIERAAEDVLFPLTQRLGIGVIVRIPLLFGLLTGKFNSSSEFTGDDHRKHTLGPDKREKYLADYARMAPLYERYKDQSKAQVALRFCISHPACHTVIPGGKTPEQVQDNCRASDLGPIPREHVPSL